MAAQASPSDLKRGIEERAERIEEYRKRLKDPNQSVRLAALDEMLKSDDGALRALAYESGFNSSDSTLRALALGHRVAGLATVAIEIELRENATENEKKVNTQWGGIFAFDMASFDEKTGTFKTSGQYKSGNGQVVGMTLQFNQQYCDGAFQLTDGAVLKGKLGCVGRMEGQYKGSINLN